MNDELSQIRALAPDPPRAGHEAVALARARLQSAMERESGAARDARSRPGARLKAGSWRARAAILAAFLLLAVAAGLGIGRGGAPSGGVSSAVAALNRLAATAGSVPGRAPASGQYLFVKTRTRADVPARGCQTVSAGVSETWSAPDSSGFQRTVVAYPRVSDARQARRCAGLLRRKAAAEGVGESDVAFAAGCGGSSSAVLLRLSSDPAVLRRELDREVFPHGPQPDPVAEVALLGRIGELLGQGSASPALRRALYEVAAGLSRVRLLGVVRDPAGREGLGLQLTSQGGGATVDDIEVRTELILDQRTSALLAIESSSTPARFGAASSFWRIYTGAAIVSSLPAGAPKDPQPPCEHTASYSTGQSRRVGAHLWITTGSTARRGG